MSIAYKQSKELNASPELTDELYNELKKYLRAERVQKKALENRNKKPLESPDVLNAEDFIFEPFTQASGKGDSGSLLIATHKTDTSKKYIVKHAYCDCAANEYVYCNIARALGVKMPDVKLFRLNDPLDGAIFETEYVVGIEYLNIVEKNLRKDALGSVKNADDYFKFNVLYNLFYESDSLEIVLADCGHIYRIDTTASFLLHEIPLFTSKFEKSSKVYELAVNNLSNKWYWNYINDGMTELIKAYGSGKTEILLAPLYDIQNVNESYINQFTETLCYFYPDCVGDYYKHFFSRMKKFVNLFTNHIEKHRPAPYFN